MIEDDGYRTSSQYRLWSFTSEQLHDLRTETNRNASDKVRAAYTRARIAATDGQASASTNTETAAIDTLTVPEEQRVVQWGCSKILEMKKVFQPNLPSIVVATAIQYLRRFYLYNSPMTYHPTSITVSCLWIATKAEHYGFSSLSSFVSQLNKVTVDDIKAPEFLIMQALRFTIEVRHPIRSLDGGVADIRMRAPALSCFKDLPATQIRKRIDSAGDAARHLLVTDTQLTDAYFLYTPAQIWLAALLITDRTLCLSYIDALFHHLDTRIGPIKQKLIDTITSCADLIKSYKSPENDKATKTELGRIGKKLKKCQDPEKLNIVAHAQAKAAEKREGNESDGAKKAKKRKLERERLERDGDVFGPDLRSVNDGKKG